MVAGWFVTVGLNVVLIDFELFVIRTFPRVIYFEKLFVGPRSRSVFPCYLEPANRNHL